MKVLAWSLLNQPVIASTCLSRIVFAVPSKQCITFTQFAGGSTKYFGTYHAEFPKPKRDPA